MKFSLSKKVIFSVMIASIVTLVSSLLISRNRIFEMGETNLESKAKAILSRMEVAAGYVASQGLFRDKVEQVKAQYPDGKITDKVKNEVLLTVPVVAAMKIGAEGAEKEGYEFRVFLDRPRRKENLHSTSEAEIFRRFASDRNLKEIVERDDEKGKIVVYRPVHLSESRGCLVCHGEKSTSPWGNGKDILGYEMEEMKDGDLHAVFALSASTDEVHATAAASFWSISGWALLGLVGTLGLAYWNLNPALKKLEVVNGEVARSAREVARVSEEIAAGSQDLSSASQESAAAIEESSASLEELTGMVESTTKNVEVAFTSAQEVAQSSRMTESSMEELIGSMNDIMAGTDRIEKLVDLMNQIGEKTAVIDEIVFQTKLLSFNASVEAERAGEHGRGFAVVAQEVGNLAQMSGKSAVEITTIVKSSIDEARQIVSQSKDLIRRGSDQVSKSSGRLREVLSAAERILEVNGQISRASQEQSLGIRQISSGMDSLNTATQRNAATAEETSASSEMLSREAQSLNALVRDLRLIVAGSDDEPVSNANGKILSWPKNGTFGKRNAA